MSAHKKNILFVGPRFFGYEVSICKALEANGYAVDFYDERTSNNSFMKAVFRVKKDLLTAIVEKYYNNITELIKNNDYDFFFLLKGEVVPQSFIVDFKKNNPKAKLIYYTYDSINNNNKNSMYILKHFDKCFSFDFNDTKKHPSLKLKHLFYSKEYPERRKLAQDRKYTLSFVGTLHSNRYAIIKSLMANFKNTFVFFFSPAKWFFWFEKTFKSHYKDISWADVSFDKLTQQDVADIFGNSKSVLDIQRFGQTGLTMRTFEVLAAGAILVTTNSAIREVDFFDPNFIVVVDDINDAKNTVEITKRTDALRGGILEINPKFEQYFVNNWIKEFFE
ncbi:hypothetical protein A0256_16675 [Mucilaginibacter sp. PAMC 26640]|nr:hypothetical protein A0256_16675 [Mucilaginibacter sp. PAMC 26640]